VALWKVAVRELGGGGALNLGEHAWDLRLMNSAWVEKTWDSMMGGGNNLVGDWNYRGKIGNGLAFHCIRHKSCGVEWNVTWVPVNPGDFTVTAPVAVHGAQTLSQCYPPAPVPMAMSNEVSLFDTFA
jgi:hypothetical protein